MNFDRLVRRLAEIDGLDIRRDLILAQHTTFRIGGPAAVAIFPAHREAALAALAVIADVDAPLALIGNGSNLLCADAGFDGVALFTGHMKQMGFSGTTAHVDAGVPLTAFSAEAQRHGLDGLAFGYGIPGSMGGAVRMNAGAYGGEMADVVCTSTCYDLQTRTVHTITDHAFAYRQSIYAAHPERVILSVDLALREGDAAAIAAQMQDFMQRRRDKQPLEWPNAGSVFKRPVGYFAGKLIEDCGLKGRQIGGAQVSEKHAGFIINRSNATADDVRKLIEVIQATVLSAFGVSLECELIYLG
ncbi:MAG: UDP-N-acetylmuramate dehydrogenase [Clostridia bacterium]|nr:UDP-N-acetylmuramate dehydrogenase [Clostridia bacterium]